ncbi:MAG TPA: amidase [Pyrinomonadaceae bacterium]|nr:amidase [Pyrinomonadaceae bacterium]
MDSTLSEELTTKSATELAALIRSRSVSSVEVVEAHLRRIERVNSSLNAVVTLATDVLDHARAAEAALTKGDNIGPLHGVPLTVKDTIDTEGLRTTAGSLLRANHLPDRDATVVARLKAAGAIILGKTNTAEMAAYYESDNPVFGRTNNPHNPLMTPGGSSGGEAAAIAACLSPAGIGSDLAGSIRLPAHFCGIAGLKPTTGRVPVDGHTPAVSGSLSLGVSIGPMARSVADLALMFSVIADDAPLEINGEQGVNLRGLRAAWYVSDGVASVDEETARAVERAANVLRDAGVEVDQVKPPGVSQGLGLWLELFSRSVSRQLFELYRGREDEAGPQVAAMLARISEEDANMAGKVAVAERLAKAVVERERLREELLRWMKTTPLIIAPVGATCAWPHGTQRVSVRGESISVFRAFSYSQTFNVFGLPCVAIPAGRSREGLPIGIQIIGLPAEERTVLAAAQIIEQALGGWQLVRQA